VITEYYGLGDLKSKHLPLSSGGWKSGIRVPVHQVVSGSPSSWFTEGCLPVVSLHGGHSGSLCLYKTQIPSWGRHGRGAISMTSSTATDLPKSLTPEVHVLLTYKIVSSTQIAPKM
jgi:hypothetical protein